MIGSEKNVSFRLSIFCGHRSCITSFESFFSNQLNESPSSWLWLTGGDCTHVFQNSSAVDFFGADIRWYETDSFSFKCNYFALQQIESLSLALTHWWWLRIFFGIPALVTVGAKKVMSLLALSSSLQLARAWAWPLLPGRPGLVGPLWRTSWVLPHQDSPVVLIRARSQTVCWSWNSKAREVEDIKIFHDTQSSRTSDG